MTEYRIDDLARVAGVSARNVRVYQEKGLLPPPRREGRAAWYGDRHLARLTLISRMLERGYTFATIDELLTAARDGLRVQDLLGPTNPTRRGPWGRLRSAARVSLAELRKLFGEDPTPDSIRRSARLGALAEAAGTGGAATGGSAMGEAAAGGAETGFEVLHPQLLEAAAELTEVGVPLEDLLELAERVQSDMADIARRFVSIVADHYLGAPGVRREIAPDASEVAEIADLIARLRPRANQVMQVLLAESMDAEIARALQRAAEQLGGDQSAGGPSSDGLSSAPQSGDPPGDGRGSG